MNIFAIDTSCDETACAIVKGRRVISNTIYSQILIHKKWGGVVPSLAKRAHEEKIDIVVHSTLEKFIRFLNLHNKNYHIENTPKEAFHYIDAIAVTQGPGLAVALEVGIKKAKELSNQYHKPVIPVNHLEGHIYSSFVQNSKGNPSADFFFPYLSLIISGGHTSIVLFKNHCTYEVIGETIDDAAGEAIDKAAKMLNLGYPGGPVIERLAEGALQRDRYHFPRPMIKTDTLNFSFSGLKTSFYYRIKNMSDEQKHIMLKEFASSFQEAVFDTVIKKTNIAIKKTGITRLIAGGGVIANRRLRYELTSLVKKFKGNILFPPYKYLTGDNAAMIAVAAYYRLLTNKFDKKNTAIDRIPRMLLT